MITEWILNTFGCPSEFVLMSVAFVCSLLPLVIVAFTRKGINVPENDAGKLLAWILVILYVIYACYAWMIPWGLIGECGY